jgi:O-antigen/teichoic acid export membrane protein
VAVAALGGTAGNLLVPRVLSVPGTADFFFLTSGIAVCSVVARLGVDRAIVKAVSLATATEERASTGTLVRAGLLTAVLIASMASLIVVLAWPMIGARLHSGGDLVPIELAATLWAGTEAGRLVISECLRGSNRVASATVFGDAGRGFLFLCLIAVMLVSGVDRLAVVVLLAAGASALVFLGALGSVAAENRHALEPGAQWRGVPRAAVGLIVLSTPFYVTTLCAFITSQGDVLIGGFTLPAQDLAFYAAASKLALVLSLPVVAVTLLLAPIIPELMASRDLSGLELRVRRSATIAAAMVVPACALCVVRGGWVMGFAFPATYAAGGIYLAILSVGTLTTACTGPNGFVLLMTDQGRYVARATLGVSAVQVVAMVLTAKLAGPIGLALASTTGTVVLNLLFTFRIRRALAIRADVLVAPWELFDRSRTTTARTGAKPHRPE